MAYGTLNAGTITPGSGNTLTLSESIALGTVTSGTLGTSVVFSSFVGMIAPFGVATAPTGWIICNGAAISRTVTYATLFGVIGTAWGVGDGSSTFNLPDLRAAFLRGTGTSTGFTQDHATTFAAFESDAAQGHYHRLYQVDGVYAAGTSSNRPGTADQIAYVDSRVRDMISDGTNGTPRTANETRPNNVGVNYCIKF